MEDERAAYVDTVRLARYCQDAGDGAGQREYEMRAARHRNRADRIEALLPPEAP